MTDDAVEDILNMNAANTMEAEAGGAAWERVLLTNPDILSRVQRMHAADRKLVNQVFCLGWFLSQRRNTQNPA